MISFKIFSTNMYQERHSLLYHLRCIKDYMPETTLEGKGKRTVFAPHAHALPTVWHPETGTRSNIKHPPKSSWLQSEAHRIADRPGSTFPANRPPQPLLTTGELLDLYMSLYFYLHHLAFSVSFACHLLCHLSTE